MKYALIIGNNRYADSKLAQLKAPAADSQALANVLGNKSIGEFDEVTPLINQTEGKVSRAISAFLASKKPDDLVLIYFSGHGVLDDRGRLFLALRDTETSLLKSTAIASSFIADEMDSCRSKRQILILDCCHSGAFERGVKGGEQKVVTATTFEGSGFGRVVLTASDSTQYALEGDQVIKQTELSLFTHFLLEGLQTGKADTNNDGYISLDEWYDYTYIHVLSTTPKQVPHKWSYHQQGDLIIARNPSWKKKVAELPAELVKLLESPYSRAREIAVKELADLFTSHDFELAELARATLERLKEDDSRTVSLAAVKMLSEVEKSVEEREAAEEAAREKAKPESIEERVEREKADKAAQEKLQREAAEKVEREKAEIAAQEKLQCELAETARKEEAERQAIEKAEREKAKREAAKKWERERAERRVAQIAELQKAITSAKPTLSKALPFLRIATFAGIAIGIIWGSIWAVPQFISLMPLSKTTATQSPTAQATFTNSLIPQTTTSTPSAIPTKTHTSTDSRTPEPLPTEITDAKGVSMMLVPAGEFMMGSEIGDPDEKPVHGVYLDAFYMDRYEVTNALYKSCVNAGVCQPPQTVSGYLQNNYYGKSKYDMFPVVYLDWEKAKAYCEWRGTKLPTEAQWEKAARGINGRTYPWGEEINCDHANYNSSCVGDITQVGSYEIGQSLYGIYDLVGNALEWVADWYSDPYYQNLTNSNPLGPESGKFRVLRGGAWNNDWLEVRNTNRFQLYPLSISYEAMYPYGRPDRSWLTTYYYYTGVRCAKDAEP